MRQLYVVASFALGFALVACAPRTVQPPPWQTQPPPVTEVEPEEEALARPVKVGLLLPLSGQAAEIGNDMLQAAQMALFDVGENEVELIPRDTAGTPEGAAEAARHVLGDGAELILGPLFGRSASAVGPIARARNVRVLAFSNDAGVAAPGSVYVLGYRPDEQVERVVGFAIDQGHRRVAAFAPDDAYGAATVGALRRAVPTRLGAEVARVQTYPTQQADISDLARRFADYDRRRDALQAERQRLGGRGDIDSREALRALQDRDTFGDPPFDAVLVPDGGARLRQVASLLAFFDVDPEAVRYLGTERWQDDPEVLTEPALQGGWFAAPAPSGIESFRRRFESVFGRRPQALAAIAYDAAALAVVLSRPSPDYGDAALTDPQGFAGASGIFRLHRNGLAERGLAVLEIGPQGRPRVIEEAPRSFPDVVALR